MTVPSGKEILNNAPIKEWFNVAEIVKRNYPEIPSWELSRAYGKALGILNKMYKWGECQKKKDNQKTLWCI